MKQGDIVTVQDKSGSLHSNGNSEVVPTGAMLIADVNWRVLAINCVLPRFKYEGSKQNDMVVCEVSHPEHTLFTRELFCTVVSSPKEKLTESQIDQLRRDLAMARRVLGDIRDDTQPVVPECNCNMVHENARKAIRSLDGTAGIRGDD